MLNECGSKYEDEAVALFHTVGPASAMSTMISPMATQSCSEATAAFGELDNRNEGGDVR
jgi:hypothetical protein